VVVTSSLQEQIGLSAPLRQFGGTTALTLSPQTTISRQPQVQNDILDTQEFYNGFLAPLSMKTLDLYFSQGYPRAFLYHLLIGKIVIAQGSHVFVAANRVGDPGVGDDLPKGYGAFQRIVEALFDAGLVTEPIGETSVVGPPLTADDVKARLPAIIAADKDGLTLEPAAKRASTSCRRASCRQRQC
jgi:hypothetical protein